MDWVLVVAGFVVGTLVAITGVGGGSLMTPFLLYYGLPPTVAVGTDLAYAALAKSIGVWLRHKARSVNWAATGLLMLGSLPAAVAVIALIRGAGLHGEAFEEIITRVLAVGLIITALTLVGYRWLRRFRTAVPDLGARARLPATIAAGVLLGTLVTLSSVGSGAIGTALLLLLYPRWPIATVVGTDLAYAVPLTATAALGHMFLGHVDLGYTLSLVVGAVPGMMLGTSLGLNLREEYVRAVLGVLLFGVGLSFFVR